MWHLAKEIYIHKVGAKLQMNVKVEQIRTSNLRFALSDLLRIKNSVVIY